MPKLNVPLIRQLQERLLDDARVEAFNMTYWLDVDPHPIGDLEAREVERIHSCGTSACIAGHVFLMLPGYTIQYRMLGRKRPITLDQNGEEVWIADVAQQALGLTTRQADQLFLLLNDPTLGGDRKPIGSITTAEAVKALDNMIAHGEPKWGEVLRG